MRPLSDFTKERDQKKMDWVGSRERECVRTLRSVRKRGFGAGVGE